jgi:hypothetical protein
METTPQTMQVEIVLEELDEGFWHAALANALTGAFGSGRFRFTARPEGAREEGFVGSPFSMPRASVAELADNVETDLEARVRLGELDTALTTAGWHSSPERGTHWWSLRYTKS